MKRGRAEKEKARGTAGPAKGAKQLGLPAPTPEINPGETTEKEGTHACQELVFNGEKKGKGKKK